MSKEALKQFEQFAVNEGIEVFQEKMDAAVAAGQTMEEACAAYARENGFDVSESEIRSFRQPLTEQEAEETVAGFLAPSSGPVVDAIAALICGHDWYFTGKEKEEPFCFFWSKHKKLYKCRKCGAREWRHED